MTIELQRALDRVGAMIQRHEANQRLARGLTVLCAFGVLLLIAGCLKFLAPGLGLLTFATVAGAALLAVWILNGRSQIDYRTLALKVERTHPHLNTLLLAALDQKEKRLNYLQTRVVREAIEQGAGGRWLDTVPASIRQRMELWKNISAVAAVLIGVSFLYLAVPAIGKSLQQLRNDSTPAYADNVEVLPGDAEVERGSTVTFSARFKEPPAEAVLEMEEEGKPPRSLTLIRALDDPLFAASLPQVEAGFTYQVRFADQKTRPYTLKVFEYPRIEQVDVQLKYPEYTGLGEKKIENTRTVSAIENTEVELRVRTNHRLENFELVDPKGTRIPLTSVGEREYTAKFPVTQTGKGSFQLTDEAGRHAKSDEELQIVAVPNRPPVIRIAKPAKDTRVSPIEEIQFVTETSDDFGLRDFGITFQMPSGEERTVRGTLNDPRAKQQFQHMLKLEQESVQPNDLISWFAWAEDIGPDGKPRRTEGELRLTTVRFLDEEFRQRKMTGEGGEPDILPKQKEIVSATWNLQRTSKNRLKPEEFTKDVGVIEKSQRLVLEAARRKEAQGTDPQVRAFLKAAIQDMEAAADLLASAGPTGRPEELSPALAKERSALQNLLRMTAREYVLLQIDGQGQGQQESSAAEALATELDIKPIEDRYERERHAQPETSNAQDLQFLNRLKELTRLQQDINAELRALEIALQQAKTEEEKEEIRRQLKRLRDQQQEMLKEMDQLAQQMNQQSPAPDSQQSKTAAGLENARDLVEQTGKEMEQNKPAQASATGAKAHEELRRLEQEFRRESSAGLAEKMRDLRQQARELTQTEQKIREQMRANSGQQKEAGLRSQNGSAAERLQQQSAAAGQLVDELQTTAALAEASEPLAASALQEAVREAQTHQVEKALEKAAELARSDRNSAALAQEAAAAKGLEQLKQGVERAAESVLGNEEETLRYARNELRQLSQALERELAAGQPGREQQNQQSQQNQQGQQGQQGQQSQQAQQNQQGQQGQQGQQSQQAQQNQQGQQGQPGQQSQQAQQNQQGQQGQQGQQSQQAQQNQQGQQGQQAQQSQQGQSTRSTTSTSSARPTNNSDAGGNGRDRYGDRPLSSAQFTEWATRLREAEALIPDVETRDLVIKARERAREARINYNRHAKLPEWDLVRTQILEPLAEAEERLAEQLAAREGRDPLAPVEHDPVPEKYSELVRQYYERLAK